MSYLCYYIEEIKGWSMNCLITGASIGIGRELALKLASLKYNVYITYFTNEKLAKELQSIIQKKYQVECMIEKCNLQKEDDIKSVIDNIKNKFGKLDILINNVSFSCDNLIENKTKQEFMDVLEVNLIGTFLMTKYAVNIMRENGMVINMASTDGIDTQSIYNIDYAASKAGIISLTKSFSLSYPNIKFIAIAPNWVDTESTREMNKEYLNSELKRIGQKELIKVDTVVNKIVHIIVDKNIKNGSLIRIDGD